MLRRFALVSTLLLAGSAVVSSVFAGSAIAGTANSNITVSTTIPPNCTITTNSVSFVSYNSAGVTANGSVTTNCNLSSGNVTVDLDQGSNAGTGSTAAAPVRRLRNGTNYLNYNLYTDSALKNVWTTGTLVSGVGSKQTTVYSAIFQGQTPSAGTYSDSVTATVNF